jgi:hypothetical protein
MLVSCTYVCVFRFFGRLFSSDWGERERKTLVCVFGRGFVFV